MREGNVNPVMHVSLDGGVATPRRAVVDRANCNQCHLALGNPAGMSIHGGIRRSTQYCVLRLNANQTDEAFHASHRVTRSCESCTLGGHQ